MRITVKSLELEISKAEDEDAKAQMYLTKSSKKSKD